jgi:hypothetical protein
MNMDNRVLKINGRGTEGLLKAVELAFLQEGAKTCNGFFVDKNKGLVLVNYGDASGRSINFPVPLEPILCLPMIEKWLLSDEADSIEYSDQEGWLKDNDHDGHNTRGWYVYCEDWGHVDGEWGTICAIKPAYCWHGK